MNEVAVIIAAPDHPLEIEIVRLAPQCGLRVIRRPLDAAELLGIASIEVTTPVVVSAGLARLDKAVVELLQRGNRLVLGLATSLGDEMQLMGWGITAVLREADADSIMREFTGHLGILGTPKVESPTLESSGNGVWSTGAWESQLSQSHAQQNIEPNHHFQEPVAAVTKDAVQDRPGKVMAVWGPQGAPGRTLTAIAIARILGTHGKRVCLIDVDTVAPALTMLTGVIEDASGIVVACRYAQRGSLTQQSLMQLARPIDRGCWLIGGISHPDRWEELDSRSLNDVLAVAVTAFDHVVVDVGFGVAASAASANLLDVPRYGAASQVIGRADALMAVTQSSPLGISRLLQQLPTVQSQVVGSLTIGVREVATGSFNATARSLRDYGLHQHILELPAVSADAFHTSSSQKMPRGFMRRKSDQWRQLERWCADLNQGEGKTTINVPTLANLYT